jgi:hypothetical protein
LATRRMLCTSPLARDESGGLLEAHLDEHDC